MARASYPASARHGARPPATGLIVRRPVAGFVSAVDKEAETEMIAGVMRIADRTAR